MDMWRNKALLAVGACAGLAVALYYTLRQIPKFVYNDDELDSGYQTSVSEQSSVVEHSVEIRDTEATSPSLGVTAEEDSPLSVITTALSQNKDAEATPSLWKVKDIESMPHSLEVSNTDATPPSPVIMDSGEMSLSLEVRDTKATLPSPVIVDSGFMPFSVDVREIEATPPTHLMMDTGATFSLQKEDTEIIPCLVEMESVVTPSLESMTSAATPSSVYSDNTEATPFALELLTTNATSASQAPFQGVECELVDDFTELHKHYEVFETIGSGGFGKVYLGRHILTGEKVAIKIMEKKDVSDALWCEIDAMKHLHHQYVCQLYQVIESTNLIYLVLEYCPGGELYELIAENEGFNEVEARRLFRQIISALAYVHSQGYAHRDLKPENLLLDEHYNIKLIDFGLCAKPEGGLGSPLTAFCGSYPYIAPELYQHKPYIGSEADIWSLGVVLFTMLCGYLPFEDQTLNGLCRQIVRGQFDNPDWLSFGSVLLLKQLLQVDPKRRVTIEKLLDHQWVMKGYSSPVEWHTTCLSHHLDQGCISEMAVLLNCSELSTIQLVSEWKYDHTTAVYLLLLAKKQRTSAARITPEVAAQNSTCSPLDNIQGYDHHGLKLEKLLNDEHSCIKLTDHVLNQNYAQSRLDASWR